MRRFLFALLLSACGGATSLDGPWDEDGAIDAEGDGDLSASESGGALGSGGLDGGSVGGLSSGGVETSGGSFSAGGEAASGGDTSSGGQDGSGGSVDPCSTCEESGLRCLDGDCVECLENTHCADVSGKEICGADNSCVQCVTEASCIFHESLPWCHNGECSNCDTDEHCEGNPSGPACKNGSCVPCHPGETRACGSIPECNRGTQTCSVNGGWSDCVNDETGDVCLPGWGPDGCFGGTDPPGWRCDDGSCAHDALPCE